MSSNEVGYRFFGNRLSKNTDSLRNLVRSEQIEKHRYTYVLAIPNLC